ncbi:hypothetical protein SAMN05216323_100110 [Williamwhitmania taraxaci]|uniref:Uncharacterized protein n=1 Tax=Williamwhitmania taraxaci TaxID=1640674 RepID=A0A1G6GG42_9BACT|nr:hypothetical protein SAMN05216323_100110 [Williamwhitmania taraxaci]
MFILCIFQKKDYTLSVVILLTQKLLLTTKLLLLIRQILPFGFLYFCVFKHIVIYLA